MRIIALLLLVACGGETQAPEPAPEPAPKTSSSPSSLWLVGVFSPVAASNQRIAQILRRVDERHPISDLEKLAATLDQE